MPYRERPKEEFLSVNDAKLITDRIFLGDTLSDNLDNLLDKLKYERKNGSFYLRQGKTLNLAERITDNSKRLYLPKEELYRDEILQDRFVARYNTGLQTDFLVTGPYFGNLESITSDLDLIKKIKLRTDKSFSKKTNALFTGYGLSMSAGLLGTMLTNTTFWLDATTVLLPVAIAGNILLALKKPRKLDKNTLALSLNAKNYHFGDDAKKLIEREFADYFVKQKLFITNGERHGPNN